jgi:hypothetical protein
VKVWGRRSLGFRFEWLDGWLEAGVPDVQQMQVVPNWFEELRRLVPTD